MHNSGLVTSNYQEVEVDESIFQETNSHAYASLKKIRKGRLEHQRLKEVSDKAFQLVENRDKLALMRHLDSN